MTQHAMVFPGQGSQKLGMIADVYEHYSAARELYNQAQVALGYDLWHVTQNESTQLNQTEYTQPAIMAASIALWQCLAMSAEPIKPRLLAGHSLGEYTALVIAGSLDWPDALALVAERGRHMQSAVADGVGGMAAIIGLDNDVIEAKCAALSTDQECVAAANYNSPGQVVIAGHKSLVEEAVVEFKQVGARMAKLLPVSVPSHCELMRPAAEALTKTLESIRIKSPQIPVIHNVNADTIAHPDDIRQALIEQLYCPVQWVKTVERMADEGCKKIIECGPGKVLTGLNKRIIEGVECHSINNLATVEPYLSNNTSA